MLQTYADIYAMCSGRPLPTQMVTGVTFGRPLSTQMVTGVTFDRSKRDGSKISSKESSVKSYGQNNHSSKTISSAPYEYVGKPVFSKKKMMIKEYLNIFFHKDIIELILNYISDIKVSTSGISSNLRSNDENFIDAVRHNLLEENEIYWQNIAQKDFGNIMIGMSSKGDFDTWKEYYNYLCFVFMNNHYRVSRIDDEYICIFGDYLDAKGYSGDKIQQILNQYKRGDMIYCRGTGGEHYYVDSITPRNNEMMYGTMGKRLGVKRINSVSFKSIEEFPVTYWESRIGNSNNIIENKFDFQPFSFVYPESLGIKLTKQDIKEITINRKQYKYFVFEHQNINYCIEFTNNTEVHSKSFYDFRDVNFWNKKQKFLCRRSCSGEQKSNVLYKDFLDYLLVNYKITFRQLLITTSNM